MRIAISGPTGCGNSTASSLVSQALRLKRYNYTFHDLARELKIPFPRLHELAEKDSKYDYLLDKKQIAFSLKEKDCVVGTRLAVFLNAIAPKLKMQKPKFDLSVWLTAPVEVRAKRIAERDARAFEEGLGEVVYRDSSNSERYFKLYGIDYRMPRGCLKIDTSRLSAEQAAGMIIAAAKKLSKTH